MIPVIIQTTCSTKIEAKNIGKTLIDEKLVACVQTSQIESMYSWKGEFCCDNETLLVIKTSKENFKKVESKIKELHSYDVPEIIQIDITKTSKKYLKFMEDNII